MCDFCKHFGDGYKRWYFNPRNYARRIYKVRREGGSVGTVPRTMGRDTVTREFLEAKIHNDTATMERFTKEIDEKLLATHSSQVVTLEEGLQILDIVYPIVLTSCVCRRVMGGVPVENENFTCLTGGSSLYKWERWPDGFRGGVMFLTPSEAKDVATKASKRGLVMMAGLYGGEGEYDVFTKFVGRPYLSGFCLCDYPDCVTIRGRMDYGIKYIVKGHYVARLNRELCNGCTKCVARCQFKAINFTASSRKAYIDMFQCFGCALCESVCRPGAISMVERSSLPALANAW